LDDDAVCCAEVRYTWKCKACGKLTTGFAVPYGRCHLCGGEHEVVKTEAGRDPKQVAVVHEAVQYELDMYHFYRLAAARTSDVQLKEVLTEMGNKEEDHLGELEAKYHVHLEPEVRYPSAEVASQMAGWIFKDIDFTDGAGHVTQVYDRAIEMERRTRDHFQARAAKLPAGPEREVYRELAAEEEEHVALLETERAQFES